MPVLTLGTRRAERIVKLRPEDRTSASPVLIVAAHPDDEVLGCGSTAAWFASQGVAVTACILSGEAAVRRQRPALHQLRADTRRAQRILGLRPPIVGSFPNIEFDTVSHLEIVRFIETAILETGAGVIFTHDPGDLNQDHRVTSHACQAAARLFQRRADVPPLRALFFMEVLSSTDWAFRGGDGPFTPDAFFPAGPTLEKKIEALAAYRGVMRPFPHPRSAEILRGLAAYRGGQSGVGCAEAFRTAFRSYTSPADFAFALAQERAYVRKVR
jgi:LmbE family N-acetylglucosaminyl deacetylase